MAEKMSTVLRKMGLPLCRRKRFKLYLNGEQKIKHDLNLFKMIQTIHKIKACLQFIIKNDKDALKEIQ